MKKIFFLAAAILAAVAVNAQTYDFRTIQSESDYEITGATKNEVESDAAKGKVVYDIKAEVPLVLTFQNNVEATIKNSADKAKAFNVNFGKGIEFGGKNGVLNIYEVSDGATITVRCAAKGSTAGLLTVVEGATGEDVALPAKSGDYVWVDATFKATASEVILKETAAGCRIESITISGATAISNTTLAPKAQKIMENGQLVILRDGVKYNALGAVID